MRRLFKAAMIVTFFSVATRALGFVLRIVLSRYLGAELLGAYQVAMSVLGVLMTIVCSGLPLVVSRSVAYKRSVGDRKGANKSVTAGLVIAVSLSVIISIVLFAFPNILNLMFTSKTTTLIVLFSLPGLIASGVYSILRSALWGEKHFFAISFTEFFEQIVRIVLCFILFSPLILPKLDFGVKASLSLSLACIASCLLVVAIYFGLKNGLARPKGAFGPIIKSSAPITALRTVSSLVSSLISIIIPLRLMQFGYSSSEAMAQFGMLMGMAFPLIMIPGTFISSIAVTLVPEISSKTDNIDNEGVKFDKTSLKNHINMGLNVSIIISAILLPALITLGKPICKILFGSSEAGKYVSAGAILMLPMGINQISSSMLNSLGLEIKSLKNYVCGAIPLILSVLFLPKFLGSYAMIVGMGSMAIVTGGLNLKMLKDRDLLLPSYKKTLFISLAFAAVCCLLGHLVFACFSAFASTFISCAVSGILSTLAMGILYLVFNVAQVRLFLV